MQDVYGAYMEYYRSITHCNVIWCSYEVKRGYCQARIHGLMVIILLYCLFLLQKQFDNEYIHRNLCICNIPDTIFFFIITVENTVRIRMRLPNFLNQKYRELFSRMWYDAFYGTSWYRRNQNSLSYIFDNEIFDFYRRSCINLFFLCVSSIFHEIPLAFSIDMNRIYRFEVIKILTNTVYFILTVMHEKRNLTFSL